MGLLGRSNRLASSSLLASSCLSTGGAMVSAMVVRLARPAKFPPGPDRRRIARLRQLPRRVQQPCWLPPSMRRSWSPTARCPRHAPVDTPPRAHLAEVGGRANPLAQARADRGARPPFTRIGPQRISQRAARCCMR